MVLSNIGRAISRRSNKMLVFETRYTVNAPVDTRIQEA